MKSLLLSALLYLPATILFILAMREQGKRFAPPEALLLAVIALGAAVGAYALATGGFVI